MCIVNFSHVLLLYYNLNFIKGDFLYFIPIVVKIEELLLVIYIFDTLQSSTISNILLFNIAWLIYILIFLAENF